LLFETLALSFRGKLARRLLDVLDGLLLKRILALVLGDDSVTTRLFLLSRGTLRQEGASDREADGS
jgi:hypothetical protein